ncbi:MAG TPA: lysophospholipid acyltransferase family protein [Candidatus Eisenbacteria bacterium]
MHALSRFAIRSALRIADSTPRGAARVLASLGGALQYRFDRPRRTAVLANLARMAEGGHPRLASARDRERAARAIFVSYLRFLFEFLAQRRMTDRALCATFRFQGTELLYRALAGGRGAVVAAPHLGNWELAGLALARLGFRVHVVTGVQLHPALSPAVRALKEGSGIRVSTPEDGFAPLLATLQGGGLVVLLVDGDVYARGLRAPFFGRETPFPAGPAILARRARAPLLHAHAERLRDGRHRISIDGWDEPDRSIPLARDLARLTERVARAQERNIAAHVTQWCIFRPFFSGPPASGTRRAA